MGFSISWIAFKNKTKEEVLGATGLNDTGETEEIPESPVSGAALPSGWYLLFFNKYAHAFLKPKTLSALSKDCQVVGCQVEEHVMASGAFCYENGNRLWSVSHESERGIYHVTVEGLAPRSLSALHARLVERQNEEGGDKAGVDYIFDVPVELAYEICVFRHDRWKFDWG